MLSTQVLRRERLITMKIAGMHVKNYRSIEDLRLSFPSYYSAICGRNDAGKSNLIRVLRSVFRAPDRFFFPAEQAVSLVEDFTKWKEKESNPRAIDLCFTLVVNRDDDEGLYLFLQAYLQLSSPLSGGQVRDLQVEVGLRFLTESSNPKIGIKVDGASLEEIKSQDVLKKIQSSFAVLFHDSTEFFHPYRFLESTGLFREISPTETKHIAEARSKLDKALSKVAKRNQNDLTEVLGRLKDKYKLGLSFTDRSDVGEIPYNITLGTEDIDVELDRWGSGTQNRTRILMTLFKAKRVRDSATSAQKITPVIVIEEPESYLHPSAQAEFGAILRDLADEFKVQVIVTTHSPYLLSLADPRANILLQRKVIRNKVRQTELVDTAGDHWMEPFGLALGIGSSELAPWKDALFTSKDSVLLVEGELDKEYFELLREECHGANRLKFDGQIFPYGGRDTLKQRQLLHFIKSRFKKFIVTYDLDAHDEINPILRSLDLVIDKDYIPIGRDVSGKKCIEGLLPDIVFQSVYASNVDLVQKLSSPLPKEARSAKYDRANPMIYHSPRSRRSVGGSCAPD